MTGLAQLTSIARSIDTKVFEGGAVQCVELEIESSKQLADVLARAGEEKVFVFRGAPGKRAAKLARHKPGTMHQAIFLNFDKLNGVVEHVKGDQVISIETGITLKELNDFLRNHGQWLPVEYLSDSVKLADVIDTGNGGYLETCSGGMKQLVLGMELAITSGETIKTGGKIVKNVTGYDLSKLFTGSRSWLAVPYMVHLRLFSRPERESSFIVSGSKPQELVALANGLRATGLPAYCIELIDARLIKHCSSVVSRDTVLASEICSLLHTAESNEAILLISTRGHKEVADEVAKALRNTVEAAGLKTGEIPSALANRIQRLCSEIFELSRTDCIELSLPASSMMYFFETFWPQNGKPFWSARPSTGRLRLAAGTNANQFMESLRKFATLVNRDGLQTITAAYPTEDMELVVTQLAAVPESMSAVSEITARLKEKYDPHGILNPLVRFTR